ncbi:MAG: hypothetical protein EB034_17460, partial [Verrucomicrobia bacterium]|nr:hypothetical protein [Verrucomicrobiota bacterium]
AFIKGVVGWVDLQSSRVEEPLAELARHPRFVGVRHVVQDEPDDNFMLRPAFQRGIGKLRQFNLAYDLLVFPKQLPAAIQLVANFPEQRFVLDHIAKPFIRAASAPRPRSAAPARPRNPRCRPAPSRAPDRAAGSHGGWATRA